MSPARPSPFARLVDDYDAGRPTYPDELYDALARLTGRLKGARVLEVGAGTGIATRGLESRGARVSAVDIEPRMLVRLRRHRPDTRVAVADGHHLPFEDSAFDLVCYAQAWHWMRVRDAAMEVVRVLRSDGACAVWWNDVDARDTEWWQAQVERIEAGNPSFDRTYRDRAYGHELMGTGLFASLERASVEWSRRIEIEAYLTWLRSKSYVAAMGEGVADFLQAERASLERFFPDGTILEPFRTDLFVLRV